MTISQQYPTTSGYDLWKTSDPGDIDADDCHVHDDTCPPFCDQQTYEDLVQAAIDDQAERRAEDIAADRYWGAA